MEETSYAKVNIVCWWLHAAPSCRNPSYRELGDEAVEVYQEGLLSARLRIRSYLRGSRAARSHRSNAKIRCVFIFTSPCRVILLLRWEYVWAALAGNRAVQRGERQVPGVKGHP